MPITPIRIVSPLELENKQRELDKRAHFLNTKEEDLNTRRQLLNEKEKN